MTILYHCLEWMKFWVENQTDTYGEVYEDWCTPVELAEIWYEEEYPEDDGDPEGTVWYSAGVFLGKEVCSNVSKATKDAHKVL